MIEFTITIADTKPSMSSIPLGVIKFDVESKDAPDATKGEIETAKALNIVLAAFKEQMALNGKKPSVAMPKNRIITRN